MRQDLSTTYVDFIGSIFQPCEMASYFRAVGEHNAIKACVTEKILLCVFSLCAKWVKSCPNPVNISTTWKKSRSFLFILDRMQWAKKPSHATVPLMWYFNVAKTCKIFPLCSPHAWGASLYNSSKETWHCTWSDPFTVQCSLWCQPNRSYIS